VPRGWSGSNAAQAYVHGDFATFHTDTFMGATPFGRDFSPEVKEQQSAADEALQRIRKRRVCDGWQQFATLASAMLDCFPATYQSMR